MASFEGAGVGDDASEYGGVFEKAAAGSSVAPVPGLARPTVQGSQPAVVPLGIVRESGLGGSGRGGFGRGPRAVDSRRFRYDVHRAVASPAVSWSASKVDRLDPQVAGDLLHAIHVMYGIDSVEEARLHAFDKALWWQHTINGASQLQPGRGNILVDGQEFEIQPIVDKLGLDARRFFRAYADDITAVNQEVLAAYDPYDPDSREKVGMLRTLATARGLGKYPHLVHDSADACLDMSQEERNAVLGAKRYYLPSVVNNADSVLKIDEARGGPDA